VAFALQATIVQKVQPHLLIVLLEPMNQELALTCVKHVQLAFIVLQLAHKHSSALTATAQQDQPHQLFALMGLILTAHWRDLLLQKIALFVQTRSTVTKDWNKEFVMPAFSVILEQFHLVTPPNYALPAIIASQQQLCQLDALSVTIMAA
jgi:ABC-type polysaccharide/polyol phosphate export permease